MDFEFGSGQVSVVEHKRVGNAFVSFGFRSLGAKMWGAVGAMMLWCRIPRMNTLRRVRSILSVDRKLAF